MMRCGRVKTDVSGKTSTTSKGAAREPLRRLALSALMTAMLTGTAIADMAAQHENAPSAERREAARDAADERIRGSSAREHARERDRENRDAAQQRAETQRDQTQQRLDEAREHAERRQEDTRERADAARQASADRQSTQRQAASDAHAQARERTGPVRDYPQSE